MSIVVEASGIGFEMGVPLSTLEAFRDGGDVLVFTHLVVREDDQRLYGFASRGERELFRAVLSVSGVGPAIALALLSHYSVSDVRGALGRGDVKALQRVKGVGKRLAERLVVELRDRIGSAESEGASVTSDSPSPSTSIEHDARATLVALGCSAKEADERLEAVRKRLELDAMSTEELVREALR